MAEKPKKKLIGRKKKPKKPAAGEAGEEKREGRDQGAFLRMQKDMSELDLPDSVVLGDIDKSRLKHFTLDITVADGYWKGGKFKFSFDIPDKYPFLTPQLLCLDDLYHPNIDMDGKVCLNVINKGWRPTYNIQAVVFGLLFLFSNPNPEDPLHQDAGQEQYANLNEFKKNVTKSLQGISVKGVNTGKTLRFKKNRGFGGPGGKF